MKKILLFFILLNTIGCSTYIANAPFNSKSVSDEAIEASGTVEYTRNVKVTPAKCVIPVTVVTTNSFGIQTVSPELIVAGGQAVSKIISPIIKNTQDSYIDLRGAAQIEITETYKKTSK